MKLKDRPWWHELEVRCPFCGGSYMLDSDDHIADSQKVTDREHGQTGELGKRFHGSSKCPYCLRLSSISKFVSLYGRS